MVDHIVAYVMHVRQIQEQLNFDNVDIILNYEIPIWNDMVSNTTVEKTGLKEVPMKSTGHDEVRVSVCLTLKVDGMRLKPFIVFQWFAPLRESKAFHDGFHRQCSVASSANGWINKELMLRLCDKILRQFSFRKRLLAWNSYEAHLPDNVKKVLTKSKTETVKIHSSARSCVELAF